MVMWIAELQNVPSLMDPPIVLLVRTMAILKEQHSSELVSPPVPVCLLSTQCALGVWWTGMEPTGGKAQTLEQFKQWHQPAFAILRGLLHLWLTPNFTRPSLLMSAQSPRSRASWTFCALEGFPGEGLSPWSAVIQTMRRGMVSEGLLGPIFY